MKKFYLLTKTLLVMALLCVGASNAWADKEYTTYYSETFDTGSQTKTWSFGSNLTTSYLYNVYNSTKYMHIYNGNSSNRTVSTSFTSEDAITSATDYILDFDWNSGTFNTAKNSIFGKLTVTGASGTLFTIEASQTAYTATAVVKKGDGTTLVAEIPIDGYRKGSAFTFFHHITITANKTDGVMLTINKVNATENTSELASTKIADFTTLAGISLQVPGQAGCSGIDNIIFKSYSDVEVVPTPTAEITGVSGASRFVTLTLGIGSKDGTTMAYSTNSDMSDANAYTAPFEVASSGTLYFQATSPTSAVSSIQSIAVECGEITLNAPTRTKTGYSAGVSTITLADDQSDKLLSPASTIKYQINDNAAQTYSSAISVNDGETLKYWSEATGYTNSAEVSATAVAPNTNPQLWTEAYSSTSDYSITAKTTVDAVTVNNQDYYPIQANDAQISDYLLSTSNSISNWLYRKGGIYGGAGKDYAIADLKAGDYVIIDGKYGNAAFSISNVYNMTLDEWNSVEGGKYCYTVTEDGGVKFNVARYGYITNITVQRALTAVPVTISAAGYATFSSTYALDFTSAGVEAYIATGGDETTVTMEKVDGTVAANTGLVLKGAAGNYNIPVVASGTAYNDNKLWAITSAETVKKAADGYTNYVLAKQNGKVVFASVTGENSASLPAGSSALCLPNPNSARAIDLVFGGITGINEAAASAEAAQKDGKFVINGQLVIKKNDKMFNAAGAQLY